MILVNHTTYVDLCSTGARLILHPGAPVVKL